MNHPLKILISIFFTLFLLYGCSDKKSSEVAKQVSAAATETEPIDLVEVASSQDEVSTAELYVPYAVPSTPNIFTPDQIPVNATLAEKLAAQGFIERFKLNGDLTEDGFAVVLPLVIDSVSKGDQHIIYSFIVYAIYEKEDETAYVLKSRGYGPHEIYAVKDGDQFKVCCGVLIPQTQEDPTYWENRENEGIGYDREASLKDSIKLLLSKEEISSAIMYLDENKSIPQKVIQHIGLDISEEQKEELNNQLDNAVSQYASSLHVILK